MVASQDTEVDLAGVDRRWLALAVLTLPVIVISMDATVLGFAVPALSASLEPSSSELLWIIDVYSFVLAGLLVTMGVLGDRIGRRRLLMLGALGFSVASVVAAFATSPATLIAARAALGVAGATLMPSTLSLIRSIFHDARERQTAIAVWAGSFAVGSAIGPIAGGALLEHFWWGSVFLAGAPVIALLLVFAPRLIPESRDPNPERFDVASAALSLVAMLPLVFAVKSLAEHGLSMVALASAAVGSAAGVAFVRRQRRIANPMIDVGLFSVPKFRMAVTGNLISCFGFAGSLFFVTQYLQLVVGMSPIRAGVQLLPAVVSSVVFNLSAPKLARRIGPFAVIAGGLLIGGTGFAMMTQLTAEGSAATVTLAVITLNAGLGAAMTVSIDGIISAIPAERAGAGASVSETANELGIALGTAVLGSIAIARYRSELTEVDGVAADTIETARETLGAATSAAEQLGGSAGQALREAANSAFVGGVHTVAIVGASAMVGAALWALRVRTSEQPTEPVVPDAYADRPHV